MLSLSIGHAQNSTQSEKVYYVQGKAAAASSYSAVRTSIVIWGVGMVIIFALVAAYVKPSKAA